jgi:hypothetical protein
LIDPGSGRGRIGIVTLRAVVVGYQVSATNMAAIAGAANGGRNDQL